MADDDDRIDDEDEGLTDDQFEILERQKFGSSVSAVVASGFQLGFDERELRMLFDMAVKTVATLLQSPDQSFTTTADTLARTIDEHVEKAKQDSQAILDKKKPQ